MIVYGRKVVSFVLQRFFSVVDCSDLGVERGALYMW
jgi:hypothetical protein